MSMSQKKTKLKTGACRFDHNLKMLFPLTENNLDKLNEGVISW